ncbi:hypothetical protein T492DRAFT_1152249 [Pavlovales sp. CCMP2436]|nr:hypothetical protein T492DRAFT_1152249 [Pavlovales sp. CCMP2436]
MLACARSTLRVLGAARRAPLGARALYSAQAPPPSPGDAVAGGARDIEARIYERAFAQYLRKKQAAYASMNSPPDETVLLRKHKERVIRMWEQLYRMKQPPDLIICLSHNADIAHEAAVAGIPTVSPVGVTQRSSDVTYPIPISDHASGVQLDVLRVVHDAVLLGAAAAHRRLTTPRVVEQLLQATGKVAAPEVAAARRAWAAEREAAAIQRLIVKRSHATRSPRGGEYAFPPEERRQILREREVSRAFQQQLRTQLRRQMQR